MKGSVLWIAYTKVLFVQQTAMNQKIYKNFPINL